MSEDIEKIKNNFYKLQGRELANLIAEGHDWPEDKILQFIQREYTEVQEQ